MPHISTPRPTTSRVTMSWISLFKSAAVATSQALESSRGHLDLYPLAHLWVRTVFRYTTGNDVHDTGFLQWVYLVPMLLNKMGNQGFCTISIPNSVRECVPLRDRNGFESCLKTRIALPILPSSSNLSPMPVCRAVSNYSCKPMIAHALITEVMVKGAI